MPKASPRPRHSGIDNLHDQLRTLRSEYTQLRDVLRDLQTEHDRRGREITGLQETIAKVQNLLEDRDLDVRRLEKEIGRCHDHLTVLQSDRDRLTCALEVACRRLASPTADQDYTRGGWRAANRIYQEEGRKS